MEIDVELHTFGALKAVNTDLAIEFADIGYMTASIWAAEHGIDFDELVDGYDMQSIRMDPDTAQDTPDETVEDWNCNLWVSAK